MFRQAIRSAAWEGIRFGLGWLAMAGVLAFIGYALLAWPVK